MSLPPSCCGLESGGTLHKNSETFKKTEDAPMEEKAGLLHCAKPINSFGQDLSETYEKPSYPEHNVQVLQLVEKKE